jgi:DNA-binding response OmpR family regulator
VRSLHPPKILIIGNDSPLTYLIKRYAEQSGCRIEALEAIPSAQVVSASKASLLLFPSLESLEAAQNTISALPKFEYDGLVMVCSSVTDETRARELGADYCLVHPLTYESFSAALAAVRKTPAGRA